MRGLSAEDVWNLFASLWDQMEELRDETLSELINQKEEPDIIHEDEPQA